jgi:hypothetical protein
LSCSGHANTEVVCVCGVCCGAVCAVVRWCVVVVVSTSEKVAGALLALLGGELAEDGHGQLHILVGRHGGQQVERLEHEPCARL